MREWTLEYFFENLKWRLVVANWKNDGVPWMLLEGKYKNFAGNGNERSRPDQNGRMD
jgi:hypothetical protein